MPKTKKQRILEYMKLSKKNKKKVRDAIKENNQLTRMLNNLNFKKKNDKFDFKNERKRVPMVNVNKISKLFQKINVKKFGEKKLSNFEKELEEIKKETNDKKYILMVIELLLGSGLLVTAIILLLIFLYNPKNNQIIFGNTDNDNNNKSLADKAKDYRDNAKKRNQKIKPSHYENNDGKNLYFNIVDKEFNIPEEKQSEIRKEFEEKNKMNFSDIETFSHYKSLKSITKTVMNDNTKNNRNINKRITLPTPPKNTKGSSTPPTNTKGPTTPPTNKKGQSTPPTVERKTIRKTIRKPNKEFNLDNDIYKSPLASLGISDRIKKEGEQLEKEVNELFY